MDDLAFPRHRRLWPLVAPQDAELAHDALHVLRVYAWALKLAPEAHADPDLAGAAALVHDLVATPKEDARRSQAAQASADAAGEPLSRAGYADDEIVAITDAVRTCSWSSGALATTPLARVLQDADRLDAIGALGLARTLTCAQGMASRGQPLRLYDPDDPLARNRRADDQRFAVDHLPVKLLRLAAGMHLPTAREEAARRHPVLVAFLEALEREVRSGQAVSRNRDEQPRMQGAGGPENRSILERM
jgi:uncharacterized protein